MFSILSVHAVFCQLWNQYSTQSNHLSTVATHTHTETYAHTLMSEHLFHVLPVCVSVSRRGGQSRRPTGTEDGSSIKRDIWTSHFVTERLTLSVSHTAVRYCVWQSSGSDLELIMLCIFYCHASEAVSSGWFPPHLCTCRVSFGNLNKYGLHSHDPLQSVSCVRIELDQKSL